MSAGSGHINDLDKDRDWKWSALGRRIQVEWVARDHYYSNPTTGSNPLFPRPGSQVWVLHGKYVCDTYHAWREFHPVWMAYSQATGQRYISGPQFSTKKPTVSGTWSAHKC
jgi:hypothetical protein